MAKIFFNEIPLRGDGHLREIPAMQNVNGFEDSLYDFFYNQIFHGINCLATVCGRI